MSKVVRFGTLKHGDPPRFKVLPEDLRKRSLRSTHSTRAFPIMVLVLVGAAAALVFGGVLG